MASKNESIDAALKISELQARVDKGDRDFKSLNGTAHQMSKQMKDLEKRLEMTEKKLLTNAEVMGVLKEKNATLEAHKTTLETELESARAEINRLQGQAQTYKDEANKYKVLCHTQAAQLKTNAPPAFDQVQHLQHSRQPSPVPANYMHEGGFQTPMHGAVPSPMVGYGMQQNFGPGFYQAAHGAFPIYHAATPTPYLCSDQGPVRKLSQHGGFLMPPPQPNQPSGSPMPGAYALLRASTILDKPKLEQIATDCVQLFNDVKEFTRRWTLKETLSTSKISPGMIDAANGMTPTEQDIRGVLADKNTRFLVPARLIIQAMTEKAFHVMILQGYKHPKAEQLNRVQYDLNGGAGGLPRLLPHELPAAYVIRAEIVTDMSRDPGLFRYVENHSDETGKFLTRQISNYFVPDKKPEMTAQLRGLWYRACHLTIRMYAAPASYHFDWLRREHQFHPAHMTSVDPQTAGMAAAEISHKRPRVRMCVAPVLNIRQEDAQLTRCLGNAQVLVEFASGK